MLCLPSLVARRLLVAVTVGVPCTGVGAQSTETVQSGTMQAGAVRAGVDHESHVGVAALPLLGTEDDERRRLRDITDVAASGARWTMLRSTSVLMSDAALGASNRRGPPSVPWRLTVHPLDMQRVSNSALPWSLNDGDLWAGRGINVAYTAGLSVRVGRVQLIAAPQLTTAENAFFQVIQSPQGGPGTRSVWANPFHPAASSIDLPLRFGDRPLRRLTPGQSSLAVDAGILTVGVSTENEWWGPGVQNAIVLSNNAPGFPHVFVRTRAPKATRAGQFAVQWTTGMLRESAFFDADPTNDSRSWNGVLIEWAPSATSPVHVGLTRAVYARMPEGRFRFGALVDAFRSVGTPDTDADSLRIGDSDQITSAFVRWVLPAVHFESYAEWARFEQPKSLGDFLEFPGHSQGYTLGLQWARPAVRRGTFRLGGEVTYLEPDASFRVRPVATTSTSQAVLQGYTNRGQALGAAIGPGSSSQVLSADLFGDRLRLGGYAMRVRWDNATLWQAIVPQVKNEDVTLLAGVRGSLTLRSVRVGIGYASAVRLDYLYQDKIANPLTGQHSGVDLKNRTLTLSVSTAVGK